jgi:hypothetical protein
VLIDAATVIAVVEFAVLLIAIGLQAALVQIATAGPTNAPALLGVFAAWDWIYNGLLYWLEAGFVALFSIGAWPNHALPRALAVFGLAVGLAHLFNSSVLMSRLPDAATIPVTLLFVVWFLCTGIYLARGEPSASGRPRH